METSTSATQCSGVLGRASEIDDRVGNNCVWASGAGPSCFGNETSTRSVSTAIMHVLRIVSDISLLAYSTLSGASATINERTYRKTYFVISGQHSVPPSYQLPRTYVQGATRNGISILIGSVSQVWGALFLTRSWPWTGTCQL